MNIKMTKTERLLLCGGLIGLASLMLQACETVMKENEDVRGKICGNWESVEGKPDILVYKEGAHYKVTLFRRTGVRRKLKPETYLLQREADGNLYMNTASASTWRTTRKRMSCPFRLTATISGWTRMKQLKAERKKNNKNVPLNPT
mgnify:CR=1 FL=1